eukprot:3149247-Rhodomonas_salina.1
MAKWCAQCRWAHAMDLGRAHSSSSSSARMEPAEGNGNRALQLPEILGSLPIRGEDGDPVGAEQGGECKHASQNRTDLEGVPFTSKGCHA